MRWKKMKIYIDNQYRCHTENPDGDFLEAEHEFFDGKCTAFVEGFCYDDSRGYLTIYPWKPYSELEAAQRTYELQQLADYRAALTTLGVSV